MEKTIEAVEAQAMADEVKAKAMADEVKAKATVDEGYRGLDIGLAL